MEPWKLFTPISRRIDCSELLSEGWQYHWEWPYGEEMWKDKMDFYEKGSLCIISCNLFSRVVNTVTGDDFYFESIEEIRNYIR